MQIIYDSIISKEEGNAIRALSVNCGISFDTARLLYCRKIDTVQKINEFLNPSINGLINPFLLNGIEQACSRINKALEEKQNVLIFGDYDADGVCATSVLYFCLKKFGINARCVVPEREEGYGLNVEKITQLNNQEKIHLLITVDCGISDFEKVEEIKNLGIDVIVTDHHEPPEILPNCITINPKIPNQKYGFSELCGTGVAYKLGYALIGDIANEYLDIVALATVSDSMELVGENRIIVSEGLKILNSENLRFSFKCLIGDNDKLITAQSLAYNIAPKINAGGRMGDANCALNLFISQSNAQISQIADQLKAYNLNRQVACDEIYKEAKAMAISTGAIKNSVILVYNKEWKTGFIGIAAARLVEEYYRPVIVFAGSGDMLKGSARSVEGINIHEVISSAKDVLEAFGGHSQAAGVTVKEENFNKLNELLNLYINEKYSNFNFSKKIHAEWKIEGKFSKDFAREIELLGPFGVGNKRPVFAIDVNSVSAMPLKSNSPHYSFNTEALEMLNFNGQADVENLILPNKKTILFETNISVFKNKESIKGIVKKVVPEFDFEMLKTYAFANQLRGILNDHGVSVKDVKEFDRKGNTLFVLNDYDNLKYYEKLIKLPISLYYPEGNSGQDCIVVSPKGGYEQFDNVVYLDRPISHINSGKNNYINLKYCGYSIIDKISLDRSDMTEAYNILRGLTGKAYISSIDLYNKNLSQINIYQFIFATEVFLELGIFKIINGVLRLDSSVKNPLANSKIYNRISELKANYERNS